VSIPGLNINLESEIPVYRQIAEGVRAALAAGRLTPGLRLPPTRDLARQLGVNRNTVVAAYDLLATDGVVYSQTGRGTFLAEAPLGTATPGAAAPGDHDWLTAFSSAAQGPALDRLLSAYRLATSSEGISFASSHPANDLVPVEEFSAAMAAVLKEMGASVLTYGPMAGSPRLRETIAAGMRSRGSRVSAGNVLITNGSQQALELVFRTLLDRDGAVVLGDPTFTGALSALGSLGARAVGVPLDDEGMRSDLLALALDRHRPRVIYVQPTFQNPTTRVMSPARRRELLSLATRYGCAVVEDDWAGELRYEGEPIPTLHALDGGQRVLYVSTFSKKLMPGLRVGWVAAPEPVIDRLVALKQIEDCGTSPLLQEALQRFLEDGGLERHLARVRPAYVERRNRLLEALDEHFPDGVHWTHPAGGLFTWVTLPEGVDSNELFLAARERGVLFSRGELFHVGASGRNTLRLGFGGVDPKRIPEGIAVLGELIRERLSVRPSAAADARSEAMPIF
jgi:GntR family transcriptional regulator/MocR family aminotransferase